jgi:hypothetical protein
MKIQITFSLRDWRKGQNILTMLGLRKEGLTLSETLIIKIEEWMLEDLKFELDQAGVEFEIEEL